MLELIHVSCETISGQQQNKPEPGAAWRQLDQPSAELASGEPQPPASRQPQRQQRLASGWSFKDRSQYGWMVSKPAARHASLRWTKTRPSARESVEEDFLSPKACRRADFSQGMRYGIA